MSTEPLIDIENGQQLSDLLAKINKASNLTDEHKSGFQKLLAAVNILGQAIKNNDDVQDLAQLIDEKYAAAAAGDRVAITALRAYRDELLKKLSEIAVNFGLSVCITAAGAILAVAGYQIVVSCAGTAAVCTGVLTCTFGVVTIVLGAIAAAVAIACAAKVIYRLLKK